MLRDKSGRWITAEPPATLPFDISSLKPLKAEDSVLEKYRERTRELDKYSQNKLKNEIAEKTEECWEFCVCNKKK